MMMLFMGFVKDNKYSNFYKNVKYKKSTKKARL